jgi:hypothetical protein
VISIFNTPRGKDSATLCGTDSHISGVLLSWKETGGSFKTLDCAIDDYCILYLPLHPQMISAKEEDLSPRG